jgi:uncharacterized protein YbcV (DUF1398 family)
MDEQLKAVAEECTKGSDEDRLTFAAVVGKLIDAGFERYRADLRRAEKTYYMPDGDSIVVPAARIDVAPAQAFSVADLQAAVKAIQAGRITYREFCARIMAAGCVDYLVSIVGRRAVYFGRTGDFYLEPFPLST